ncbi:carboxylesterase family protein [Schlesneria paludicola]|uniref:carboxylesterase family protein n=1 Tax=Schlesneria paludicola TaxID=360056 RepID=UPI00029B1036|nr:dienelactone hydrolase family protein [Schlesneria paludicola]
MKNPYLSAVWRRPLLWCLVVVISSFGPMTQAADSPGHFYERVLRDDAGEHKYLVFIPTGYRSEKASPAMLFLHGAGERGTDNRLPLTVGIAPFIQARVQSFPFLVVIPQCEMADGRILESWNADHVNGKRALAILDDARKHYNFDEKRVVLTGWSMGGYGTWSLATAEPTRWSAVVPLSGGGDARRVEGLKDVPVWAFHGEKDTLIKSEDGRKIVEALSAAGGTATYTELPDAGHDINTEVYGNDAVIAWMLDPRRTPAKLGTATVKPVPAISVPFVPALEISQAVGVRLGNEVLDIMSYSIPRTISPSMLSGSLGDMFDSTVASGRQFSIRFGGISYSGQLERIVARGYGKDRILVQLGIRNVAITIAGTSVTGERHSAQAGPIAIRIGYAYPVWFNLELTPYVADRKIRLRLIGAGFQIPQDNWSVSQPAGVSVQGFGMTQEAVVSGLTNGLYGARGRIENAVLSIAPQIVQEIEKNLVLPNSATQATESGSTMTKLWPLPMYPPRFQAWPEQISADENGLSLVVGLTVASLNPFTPVKELKRATGTNISLQQVPTDKLMHVVVAPNILEPITAMFVESHQARLDLLDIPEPLFAKLADRATLQELIPDLAQFGDGLRVRSTVNVLKPLTVRNASSATGSEGAKSLEFELPKVQVLISIKSTMEQAEWQPCAAFDLDLSQQLKASLQKPSHDQRIVALDWLSAAKAQGTGKFADGYSAKDATLKSDRYVELFNEAWAAYFAGIKGSSAEIPDLPIGDSKMRLADVKFGSPAIDVTYTLARIKISNLSNESFTYQTKAPSSSWGEPLTLKPGAFHEFEIPYPLTYRRNLGPSTEVYTLPVGSHSEYRVPVTGGAPRLFAAKRP